MESTVSTPQLPADWAAALSPYFAENAQEVVDSCWSALGDAPRYPSDEAVFHAFACTPVEDVRVVIVGQDPYHGPGQAHGLAFSVQAGCPHPPSLRNVLKEAAADCGCAVHALQASTGDLTRWAEQGVLLLNDVLTVEPGRPGSHAGRGWEALTDAALRAVADRPGARVFVFWGRPAAAKSKHVHRPEHAVLRGPHPSPLSAYRGFFGSRPFTAANAWLTAHGEAPIRW